VLEPFEHKSSAVLFEIERQLIATRGTDSFNRSVGLSFKSSSDWLAGRSPRWHRWSR